MSNFTEISLMCLHFKERINAHVFQIKVTMNLKLTILVFYGILQHLL